MIRAYFVTMYGKTFTKDFEDVDHLMRFVRAAREAGTRLQGFYSIDE